METVRFAEVGGLDCKSGCGLVGWLVGWPVSGTASWNLVCEKEAEKINPGSVLLVLLHEGRKCFDTLGTVCCRRSQGVAD